jgi:hypothetical protein
MNRNKQVPEFRSEEDERDFWAKHDSTQFVDWQAAQSRRFPNLKPSLRTISLRLPVSISAEDFSGGEAGERTPARVGDYWNDGNN